MSANSLPRVQIFLKKSSQPTLVQFGECIVDYFGFAKEGSGYVGLKEDKDCITLFQLENPNDSQAVLLRHALECPVFEFNNKSSLPQELKDKGVGLGVAILLTSCDNHVLVTRRASHMRTFPGVWVPPGGHVELGESLLTAALRELHEETGLELIDTSHTLLGLWESVYPHKLEFGDPIRQHIVAYFTIQSKLTSKELLQLIKLDPQETDAAMWLPQSFVESISTLDSIETYPEHLSVIHQIDGVTQQVQIDAAPIIEAMAPPPNSTELDLERLTWGTRFALRQWVKLFADTKNSKL